jgi:hypothetical protein
MFLPSLRMKSCLAAVLLSSAAALACSCSNNVPVQRNLPRYAEKAVFTARIIQLVGRKANGWRQYPSYSTLALAEIKTEYWGVPKLWPRVVLLDGRYPCDIPLFDGMEYFVSGWRVGYGIVAVNHCSRTTLLNRAQIDLRTADGSACAARGGALLGTVQRSVRSPSGFVEAFSQPGVTINFRSDSGKTYSAKTDGTGIYELRNLPAGTYQVEPAVAPRQYARSAPVKVTAGMCSSGEVEVNDLALHGRVPPSTAEGSALEMIDANTGKLLMSTRPLGDGRFFLSAVPDGPYYLRFRSASFSGPGSEVYYPGVLEKARAEVVKVGPKTHEREYVFTGRFLPLRPVLDMNYYRGKQSNPR